jgi:hypothetical protein
MIGHNIKINNMIKLKDLLGEAYNPTSFKNLKPREVEKAFEDYMEKNHSNIVSKWGDTNGTIDSRSGRFYITTHPIKGGLEIIMMDREGGSNYEKRDVKANGSISKKDWGTASTLEKAVELYKKALNSDDWKKIKSR